MRVHVRYDGLTDLEHDLRRLPGRMHRLGIDVVRDNVAEGGRTARRIARWTSGRHAKKYPGTITWDRSVGVFRGFGGGQIKGEYGPEPRGQGLLATILENGSRNNPAHNNLIQSLDIIRPKLHRDVEKMLDDLFWAGAK